MVCDAFRSNEKIYQTYDLKLRENADILLVASLIKLAVSGLEFTLFPRAPCPSLTGFEINFSLEELNV